MMESGSSNKDALVNKILGRKLGEEQSSSTVIRNEDEVDSNIGSNGDTFHSIPVPLSETDVLLAATYVQDARLGRHSEFKPTEKAVSRYVLYQSWYLKLFLLVITVMHLSLLIIEDPSPPHYLAPYWFTVALEFVCLIFYCFRSVHIFSYMEAVKFWSDRKNVTLIALILLVFIDIIIYIGLTESDIPIIRWSRVLRPFFFVNLPEGRQVRRAFRNIRRTLPDVLNVLILFFLTVALASLMAYKLFSNRGLSYPTGKSYFEEYYDALFDMYVLVSTANNPDIMMPAYKVDSWYSVFFIVYTIIALFVFMNVFLAVVYNNYRRHLKEEIRKSVYSKRQQLAKAFELIKVYKNGKFYVTRERFFKLLHYIPPYRSNTLASILWFVLDSNNDDTVDKAEFLQLADLLNVEVSEYRERLPLFSRLLPNVYNSTVSKWIRNIVRNKWFRYFFDCVIVVNAVFIAAGEDVADWYFLGLFSLEILLKMYTFGFRNFCRSLWNLFDVVVIGSAIIVGTVEEALDHDTGSRLSLDTLLVLRCLRLVKIISNIERFKVVVTTIVNLLPAISTYGAILAIIYYVFGVIGMELFSDLIDESHNLCGNPHLEGSQFVEFHYCKNNFNDIFRAFVVLYDLTLVNQWQVITAGIVAVTSKWARIYFFMFHLTAVLVVLNIFTAFVLEVFILEYSLSKGRLESRVEAKIQEMGLQFGARYSKSKSEDKTPIIEDMDVDDTVMDADHNFYPSEVRKQSELPDLSAETDIRFHLKKSLRNVDVILQRMFENEITLDDLGCDEPTQSSLEPRRLTLSHDA